MTRPHRQARAVPALRLCCGLLLLSAVPLTVQACDPFPIKFNSTCRYTAWAAVRAKLYKDVDADYCRNSATKAGEWCTRFWFEIPSNGRLVETFTTQNGVFYVYAYFNDGFDDYEWIEKDVDNETRSYDITSGEMCSSTSATCKKFTHASCQHCCWGSERVAACHPRYSCQFADCLRTRLMPVLLLFHLRMRQPRRKGL